MGFRTSSFIEANRISIGSEVNLEGGALNFKDVVDIKYYDDSYVVIWLKGEVKPHIVPWRQKITAIQYV